MAALRATPHGRALLHTAAQELAAALQHDQILHLSALRLAAGLTQAELAARVGMTQPQLSRLESGRQRDVLLSTLQRLARALGQPLADVVSAVAADGLPQGETGPAP